MYYRGVESVLNKLVFKNRCPQSFIFYGRNKSEMERIAKNFSFKILGTNVKSIRDIIEFKCDRKNISVDDIRMLNIELLKKPENFNNKVVLIYDADKMTNQAQNSFLKSLEDSNENIFIVLIVNNIANIINTIISRCLLIKFDKMDILEYVEKFETYNLGEEKLKELHCQTNGDIDITNSFLNKGCVYKIYSHILKLFEFFCKQSLVNIFEFAHEINSYRENINIFFETTIGVLRDIYVYKNTNDKNSIYSKYFREFIIENSKYISNYRIQEILDNLIEFRHRIKLNLNLEICYKIFILKKMEE